MSQKESAVSLIPLGTYFVCKAHLISLGHSGKMLKRGSVSIGHFQWTYHPTHAYCGLLPTRYKLGWMFLHCLTFDHQLWLLKQTLWIIGLQFNLYVIYDLVVQFFLSDPQILEQYLQVWTFLKLRSWTIKLLIVVEEKLKNNKVSILKVLSI